MASFSNQVAYKTGDTTSYSTQMAQWLDDGVKAVVDTVTVINPNLSNLFAKKTIFGNTGWAVGSSKIIKVHIDNTQQMEAPIVDEGIATRGIADSGSIYGVGLYAPLSYISSGVLKIGPSPVSGSTGAYVIHVSYGTVDDTNGTISNMPDNFYEGVVLYAAIRSQEYLIGDGINMLDNYLNTLATYIAGIAGLEGKFDDYITSETSLPDDVKNVDELLAKIEDYIQDDEDIELAQATIGNLSSLLERYRGELADMGVLTSAMDGVMRQIQDVNAIISSTTGKVQSLRSEYAAFFERVAR